MSALTSHIAGHVSGPSMKWVGLIGNQLRAAATATNGVKFKFKVGEDMYHVSAEPSKSLLDVAHANKIALDGACEGSCACATCHLVFTKDVYDKLSPPSEDEEDMLEMAHGLTPTSRLGCQVLVSDALEGTVITLPSAQRNV